MTSILSAGVSITSSALDGIAQAMKKITAFCGAGGALRRMHYGLQASYAEGQAHQRVILRTLKADKDTLDCLMRSLEAKKI